jgi:hypothetical protein
MKPFWHRESKKNIESLIKKGLTIQYLLENYRQPTWCNYPDALAGMMGCWSLTGDNRTEISHKFCSSCECYVKKIK